MLDRFQANGSNPYSGQAEILDLRVNEVEEEAQELEDYLPGLYHKDGKKTVEFEDTKTAVHNVNKTLLKAGHTTVILLSRGKGGRAAQPLCKAVNDVYLHPKVDHKLLNSKGLLLQPGVHFRTGNTVQAQVTNFSNQDVYLPRDCHMGYIHEAIQHIDQGIHVLDHTPVNKLTEAQIIERREFIIQQLELDNNEVLQRDPAAREEVISIFMDNWDAVSVNEYDFGHTNLVRLQIQVAKDAKPVRAGVRPLNPFQKRDLDRQLEEWTRSKVIEPSASAWSSALVPCKKKNTEKLRWALDFRRLNELTVKDAYPIANIESNIQQLSGSKYFSALDSSGAFHCVGIDQESRDYTAFNTYRGQYRFCRMPFGLCNAPSTYSRLVQMALDRLPPGFALGYLDDIIVHSSSLSEHLQHLRQVVNLHVSCGMKLNLKKCHLVRTEVVYLGHLVSQAGVRMVPDYVERILDWPLPTTGKELRSFLGFCGYYRSFIKEFASLTAEMNKMKTSKDKTLVWKPETQQDFETLKQCFAKEPVRGYPQYFNPAPFILDTDWSRSAMAAVLSQEQDGKEVFLGAVAKKCSTAEQNYSSHKGEMAAVILGLKKFEHILRAKPFIPAILPV